MNSILIIKRKLTLFFLIHLIIASTSMSFSLNGLNRMNRNTKHWKPNSFLGNEGNMKKELTMIANDSNKKSFIIPSFQSPISNLSEQYRQRLAADPNFLTKSILEIFLATTSQIIAEINRRGYNRILPEFDFVFAAILTAIIGKYYSMWRVAPTCTEIEVQQRKSSFSTNNNHIRQASNSKKSIPNNAFQSSSTHIPIINRIYAFLIPMPSLFQAGFLASLFGYGLTSLLIQFRTIVLPHYISQTQPVPILGASIFTGIFVAFVSNLRYQLLQGLIEPRIIETIFQNNPFIKRLLISIVRYANGVLGSSLAIMGMRYFGLQKLS